MLPKGMTYIATNPKVVDGDTLWLTIHLAPGAYLRCKCRLWAVDAPELNGPQPAAARIARSTLEMLVTQAQQLWVTTMKGRSDKYGRELIKLLVQQRDGQLTLAHCHLLSKGVVRPYQPGTAQKGFKLYCVQNPNA